MSSNKQSLTAIGEGEAEGEGAGEGGGRVTGKRADHLQFQGCLERVLAKASPQNGQLWAVWIRAATKRAMAGPSSRPGRVGGAGLLSPASSIWTDSDGF